MMLTYYLEHYFFFYFQCVKLISDGFCIRFFNVSSNEARRSHPVAWVFRRGGLLSRGRFRRGGLLSHGRFLGGGS